MPDHPALFKRPVLLIVGCGDIGLRVARLVRARWRVLALTSSVERIDLLRGAGVVPLQGNLDSPQTLARLADLADAVLHLAPPANAGTQDTRTRHLVHALARSARLRTLVYASTSGVYGDAAGAWVDETRALRPATARAGRRVDAEGSLRRLGRQSGVRVTLLRVPGIYALDRAGGDPRERLVRGTALLAAEDDVFTNHIHADDLARACVLALHRGRPQRAVNVNDDSTLRMGEYFDLAAELFDLPRAPRVSRADAATQLLPVQLSFMDESRRLVNRRLKKELGLALRYPTVASGLRASPD